MLELHGRGLHRIVSERNECVYDETYNPTPTNASRLRTDRRARHIPTPRVVLRTDAPPRVQRPQHARRVQLRHNLIERSGDEPVLAAVQLGEDEVEEAAVDGSDHAFCLKVQGEASLPYCRGRGGGECEADEGVDEADGAGQDIVSRLEEVVGGDDGEKDVAG